MTIPLGCVRVRLNWTPDQDQWPNEVAVNTFAVRIISGTIPADDAWQPVLTDITEVVQTLLSASWGTLGGIHAAGYQISSIAASSLNASAHTIDEYVRAVTSGTLPGTGTSGVLPPEVAICLSLYGYVPGSFATQRGRKRGRIYLPYLAGSTLEAHGKVSSAAMDSLTSGWKTVFDGLSPFDVPDGIAALGVISETGNLFTEVGYIAVDNHFDAQRRRQHQSPAVRQVVNLS